MHPDDYDYPMTQADLMRDQHTESVMLGLGCPFDCCDPMAQYDGYEEEDANAAEQAEHDAFRSHIEIFRTEAIATGRTVTVVWA